MSLPGRATAGLLVFLSALLWHHSPAAAPVPVRFAEGSLHGFLVLGTPQDALMPIGVAVHCINDATESVVRASSNGSVIGVACR